MKRRGRKDKVVEAAREEKHVQHKTKTIKKRKAVIRKEEKLETVHQKT